MIDVEHIVLRFSVTGPEAEDIRLANRLLYGTAILAWGIGILFFLR